MHQSADDKLIRQKMNDLVGDVRHFCGLSEHALFLRAFPEDGERAHSALHTFMRDVRTCPDEVIQCAELLIREARAARTDVETHLDRPIACPRCGGQLA